MAVMIWNYHDDALPKPDAQISFNISNAFPGCKQAKLTHYRIDQSHTNAYSTWLAMGSPQDPTNQQYESLQAAGMLQMLNQPTTIKMEDGSAGIEFELPIHATSLLMIERQSGNDEL